MIPAHPLRLTLAIVGRGPVGSSRRDMAARIAPLAGRVRPRRAPLGLQIARNPLIHNDPKSTRFEKKSSISGPANRL